MEDFLLIRRCQVAKFDSSDMGNINNTNEDIMSSWQDIIYQSGQLLKKEIDTDYA